MRGQEAILVLLLGPIESLPPERRGRKAHGRFQSFIHEQEQQQIPSSFVPVRRAIK
jgi:hypothetical protein